ncbi:MAG: histidine kinase, partial [Gemmatimonadales bacterium]|nr:histidine kinase [Gemmatimonadales bacterium]
HLASALAALPLAVGVLLLGRTRRNRRLREAGSSLAASELRAVRAEALAARAELAALQARLNPHFLSNALHSVSALIGTDPEGAEDALDQLGGLFRYSLEQSERPAVPLAAEWEFVRDYLAIEQIRLGNRLTVKASLDPEAAEYPVPPFTLQPLVENAVRHGIGPKRAGGTVRIEAVLRGETLELSVEDDGAGADLALVSASAGTGLRTLRQRLELDRDLAGCVEIHTAPGRGFRAVVSLAVRPPSTAR